MSTLLGDEGQKIHPKLRLFASASAPVNAIRAEHCASMRVDQADSVLVDLPLRGEQPLTMTVGDSSLLPERPKLKQLAEGVKVNVFIETQTVKDGTLANLPSHARRGNLIAATINLDDLPRIAQQSGVLSIEPGESLVAPTPEFALAAVSAPDSSRWSFGSQAKDGEGVLLGIIDVQGFDFAHPDFLDGEQTRFVRIWDQGGSARPSPHRQDRARYGKALDFGAEFRQEHLNQALAQSKALQLPPQEIERQSQMIPSSHGTHVASIAAGNRGICRKAAIAGVLISVPQEDDQRRTSFYDSTRIVHAVDYLTLLAEELGLPLSINISLGTNGHAHDGTGAVSRWIDAALASPGRCACVAAGNAGQEVATFPGDLGFVMGRIHTSGKIPGRFLHQDIEWIVAGNGRIDVSENELEVWYSEQDRFAVSVLPPLEGSHWIGPVEPNQYVQNHQLADGSFVSIFNELYHPSNGNNYVSIFLSPFFGSDAVIGVPTGTWKVRIHGRDVRDGRYHGWIERDDPRKLGRIGNREAWRFPSYFSENSNVDESSVGSLACGRRVVAVANLHHEEERTNITSSQGPTRDGRNKPDVAAPGTQIVAANGFTQDENQWIAMTGTSMASPYVAGVVGLMLAINPKLTAAQIEGILHRTSRPLPGKPFAWTNDAGFGMINPEACLREAAIVNQRNKIEP